MEGCGLPLFPDDDYFSLAFVISLHTFDPTYGGVLLFNSLSNTSCSVICFFLCDKSCLYHQCALKAPVYLV